MFAKGDCFNDDRGGLALKLSQFLGKCLDRSLQRWRSVLSAISQFYCVESFFSGQGTSIVRISSLSRSARFRQPKNSETHALLAPYMSVGLRRSMPVLRCKATPEPDHTPPALPLIDGEFLKASSHACGLCCNCERRVRPEHFIPPSELATQDRTSSQWIKQRRGGEGYQKNLVKSGKG